MLTCVGEIEVRSSLNTSDILLEGEIKVNCLPRGDIKENCEFNVETYTPSSFPSRTQGVTGREIFYVRDYSSTIQIVPFQL